MQFFVEFIKCIKKGLLQKKLIIGFLTRWNVIRNIEWNTLIIKRAISFLQQPHNKWFDKNGILANFLAINPLVSNDSCFFRHAGFPKTTRNTSAATKRWVCNCSTYETTKESEKESLVSLFSFLKGGQPLNASRTKGAVDDYNVRRKYHDETIGKLPI